MSETVSAAKVQFELPTHNSLRWALGRAEYIYYRLLLKKRYEGFVLEEVCGAPLVVAPGVLNPRLMRTGKFFAGQLATQLQNRHATVLDMGTGSGVCAVVAARCGHQVVAVDISAAAVRCARVNILMNGVEDRARVLQGDLFASLSGCRFDVVLFNPPFLRGTPRDDADRAWRSVDVPERFASGLREHLTPKGYALVLLSSFGGAANFLDELQRQSFQLTIVAEHEYVNEKLAIFKAAPI